jgi:uncharacterized membrane protein
MNIGLMLLDFTSFLIRLQKPHVITGLILAIVGLATIFLARRIAFVARKEENKDKPIENNNKTYITIKAFGLVMLLVSLIVMVFE